MPRATVCVMLLAGPLLHGGCAFGDGNPWGYAEVTSAVRLALPASRLVGDTGRLRTARDYHIAPDALTLHVETITLTIAADSSTTTAFDPARPPAGYHTCHNGHCHTDDGRLVDYADIAAQLGSNASDGPTTRSFVIHADVPLDGTTLTLPVAGCETEHEADGRCILPRGTVTRVTLQASRLSVAGTAYEGRTNAQQPARLPVEGLPFSFTLDEPLRWSTPLDETIGAHSPLALHVETLLDVSVTFLDTLDFSTLAIADGVLPLAPALRQQLILRLSEDTRLVASHLHRSH